MSHVSNCILHLDLLDKSKLAEINKFFDDETSGNAQRSQKGFVDVDEISHGWYGGSKFLETVIAIGAFNYLNCDRLIEHIRSIGFEVPEGVQLIIQGQHAYKLTLIDVFGDES